MTGETNEEDRDQERSDRELKCSALYGGDNEDGMAAPPGQSR